MKKIILFLVLMFNSFGEIPQNQLDKVAELIFNNEASGKKEGLIVWNNGEEFISLGIGHFIWYPKDYNGVFQESFPDLQEHLVKRGYVLPKLLNFIDAPWNNKEEYLAARSTDDYKDAIEFLYNTKEVQMELIGMRAEKALQEILKYTDKPDEIEKAFYDVYTSPFGIYPLIDYVNFKGEGIKASEQYNNQSWGLLQVLEIVAANKENISPIDKFVLGAKFVLKRRVDNSDPARNEAKWLPGWNKRIDTYKTISSQN